MISPNYNLNYFNHYPFLILTLLIRWKLVGGEHLPLSLQLFPKQKHFPIWCIIIINGQLGFTPDQKSSMKRNYPSLSWNRDPDE